MKLRIIALIALVVATSSPLIGMQKTATPAELRALMTAERQKAAAGQPTNYLGMLPQELREEVITYTLERDTAPYQIRVDNRSTIPGLVVRVAAGSGDPNSTTVLKNFTNERAFEISIPAEAGKASITWPLRFRIGIQNTGQTVLTQQFTKDEAIKNFSAFHQGMRGAPHILYFVIVDDSAHPGSVKIVNQFEANQGYILPYERH